MLRPNLLATGPLVYAYAQKLRLLGLETKLLGLQFLFRPNDKTIGPSVCELLGPRKKLLGFLKMFRAEYTLFFNWPPSFYPLMLCEIAYYWASISTLTGLKISMIWANGEIISTWANPLLGFYLHCNCIHLTLLSVIQNLISELI